MICLRVTIHQYVTGAGFFVLYVNYWCAVFSVAQLESGKLASHL